MPNEFYNAFDLARLDGSTPYEDHRSTFQIDRDRVLHTPAFRSLQSKTQVFWSGEYDFYRTRLTHSLEVAQIGRGICHWLKTSHSIFTEHFFIDPDLVEAACLSHDLGHPPFGHAGERSLNHFMAPYGGFEGNAQTLRLLTNRIFSESRKGMNPSRAFLDSILKYKTLWSELKDDKGPPENHFLYDEQNAQLDFTLDGVDFPIELTAGKPRDAFKSIECQIMDWADDTAYSLNDLADSVRAGFLTSDKIQAWAERHQLPLNDDSPLGNLLKAIRKGRIDSFAGRHIGDYIRATSLQDDTNILSARTNRYRLRLLIDEEIRQQCDTYKKLAYEVVFLSPALKQLEHKGSYLLRQLWELLETRYINQQSIDGQFFRLLREEDEREIAAAASPAQRARLICDFLAAMTDSSAARLSRRLFEPGFGSIGDLV